jgi:myo-inositol-1(or 4)-monophosphatase
VQARLGGAVGLRALERVVRDAAAAAARVIRGRAADRASLVWDLKSPTDFVSEVDHAAEAAARTLLDAFAPPGVPARLMAEEGSPEASVGEGITFVLDPLDGTTNFLHGFPWYCVSLAALVDGELAVGVVHHAAGGGVFSASLGAGARHAGRAIRVTGNTDPARALIGTGVPFKKAEQLGAYLPQLDRVARLTAGVRRPGSAALDLCEVARGVFDGFWELEHAPWDMAAGTLIAREAGALVTDLAGRPAPVAHGPVVAGPPAMHAWLLAQLNAHTPAP